MQRTALLFLRHYTIIVVAARLQALPEKQRFIAVFIEGPTV
jgi:hypothetical protein